MFGGETQKVTLLFTPKILSDMFDRYGDDIRIRKIDDNTYTVDVAVQVSKTFFAWIVGTQGKVKIKAPEKVLEEFSDFVAKIKEVYQPVKKMLSLRWEQIFLKKFIKKSFNAKFLELKI